MKTDHSLKRFLDAQDTNYSRALAEIRNGRKQTHWMWYIFPQIAGLGVSETARFYAINDIQEARDYLEHPILGNRLVEIANAMLQIEGKSANQILGNPDDLKLHSSMTLFSLLDQTDPVFQAVLGKYFNGIPDQRTLAIVKNSSSTS
ncbi:DUF1810 domain-containing protein [Spirosoma sp. KCTC 42546]|uniref:DUF1810 domain-containing protein n=1 Tax=Spirosoma sp. KCTC 42546 TaxID=2520506 RepID=UPI00115AE8E3|nr:DUF1810 domain-containing protein [Spirosoma sp. KCTC 42546]QDK77795.1 DUF1810 domain-containing protein [Spirosoma sp. KCTC 42546]